MLNTSIVPLEVQQANKDKPIPYGLWDSYRKRYKWKISLDIPNEGKSKEITYFFYNGEMEILFGESQMAQFPDIRKELQWDHLQPRGIPNDIKFTWLDTESNRYVCNVEFNEEEIFKVFQEMYKDHPDGEVELEIYINMAEDDAAVQLIGNGKRLWITDNEIEVYKIR